MRIQERDFTKHPLTKAEIEKLARDGKRDATRRLREIVEAAEQNWNNKHRGKGPRY